MSKFIKIALLVFVSSLLYFCNKKAENTETVIEGTANVLVDETIKPIMDDEVMVFESEYDAKIVLQPKSESEVIQSFTNGGAKIAVLSRKLNDEENKFFASKKIIPKVTLFATDAIAFISNKNNNDTLIALQDVIDFMKGKSNTKIKGLVFDNLNSSTVRYMNELAGIQKTPEQGVYSFKTNEEVIKHVSENAGMIGVVGANWLSQPMPDAQKYKDNINILSVKPVGGTEYFYPSQNNLAEKKYPLARDLYIINCQGFSGLGMGFASFVAGERGQRIILKSDLLPTRIPTRKLNIRNTINKEKQKNK